LRRLLVLGATAVIQQAKAGRASPWLLELLARKPKKLAAVALANKMARIVGHDGERRDLPAPDAGLSPPTTGIWDTWHWQGRQQQDGDRSIRGSGQPGGPDGA
jgi:hypothetical protein